MNIKQRIHSHGLARTLSRADLARVELTVRGRRYLQTGGQFGGWQSCPGSMLDHGKRPTYALSEALQLGLPAYCLDNEISREIQSIVRDQRAERWRQEAEAKRAAEELQRQQREAREPADKLKHGFTTLKAAYLDGWEEMRPEFYDGEVAYLKGHTLVRGHKIAVSATEWARRGRVVIPDQAPHAHKKARLIGTWPVWREEQTTHPGAKLKLIGGRRLIRVTGGAP